MFSTLTVAFYINQTFRLVVDMEIAPAFSAAIMSSRSVIRPPAMTGKMCIRDSRKHAEKILGSGACLLVIFTIVLMAVFYLFQKPFLYMFGASDATIGYSLDYMSIYLLGTLFVELSLIHISSAHRYNCHCISAPVPVCG